MPYKIKNKCVYKQDTMEKVGCTKGSIKKYLSALHANIKESEEEDNLEWARDIIKGIDDVIELKDLDTKKNLSIGSILKITGTEDELFFEDQECKIIYKDKGSHSSNYLMVFPEEISGMNGYYRTHCGQVSNSERLNIEYKCGCSDVDSDIGKCWYITLSNMKKVELYPNRLGLVNESEEDDGLDWARELVSNAEKGVLEFKGKELFIDIRGFSIEERSDLYQILEPYINTERTNMMDWSYNCLLNEEADYVSIALHCGTEDNNFEPEEGNVCCLNITFEEDGQGNKSKMVPIDGRLLLNIKSSITESKTNKTLLTEGRYDAITRKVVKDIMQVVIQTQGLNDELHQSVLPWSLDGNEEYTQEGLSFTVELNVHHQYLNHTSPANKEEDSYYVHTAIADDDSNVIMMTVVVDPSKEPTIYEKLFYKLQEDIRHEIEHFTQEGPNRIDDRPTSKTNTAQLKTTFGHHKHKLEIPALVHGFYRRAKLEKKPIDEIMIEDLDSEIERGNLTKKQSENLLKIWIEYSKKNLPHAVYSEK